MMIESADMAGGRCARMHGRSRSQQGFGGFLLLTLVAGLTAAAGLFTFYRTDVVQTENARTTGDALTTAKSALIAYAVHREGQVIANARPGDLPCPDINGDGL